MKFPGAMAPLAIDAFPHTGKNWIGFRFAPGWNLRIRIVAEHAIEADQAPLSLMVWPVITGIHCPVADGLGIPAKGKFDQSVATGPVQIGSRMVAGADDEVDFRLGHVRLFTVKVELILALEILPIMLHHRVVSVRRTVIVGFCIVFDPVVRGRPVERSPHARAAVTLPDAWMTSGADLRVEVSSGRATASGTTYNAGLPPHSGDFS